VRGLDIMTSSSKILLNCTSIEYSITGICSEAEIKHRNFDFMARS